MKGNMHVLGKHQGTAGVQAIEAAEPLKHIKTQHLTSLDSEGVLFQRCR